MATIRPFMAIRPASNYAAKVAALPYDVMNSEEAREMVKDKPWSFLHVDKAEVDLPWAQIFTAMKYIRRQRKIWKT